MNDEQIVAYVKEMIMRNLSDRGFSEENFLILNDETNKTLIAHIDGITELFTKAKEILEEGEKDGKPV